MSQQQNQAQSSSQQNQPGQYQYPPPQPQSQQVYPMAPMSTNQQQQVPFRRIQQSYAVEVPYNAGSDRCYEGMLTCFGCICGGLGSVPCLFCFPNPFQSVPQGSVGLIKKFGKFIRSVDPGLYQLNPFCEKMQLIDVRQRVQDCPRQTILTKDNVSVDIDSVLYWDILDPYIAAYLVIDVQKALIDRTLTTLRMVLGNRTLQDTIEHRDTIAQEIRDVIDNVAESWGVKVESILIKDVILGPELLASMSAAASQRRIGDSKIIAAQAEVNAAKLMRQASDILNSPAAMQIRFLETLQTMSKTPGTKVIFMPPNDSAVGVKGAMIYDQLK
ncbi:hypothetical protein HDV01_000637 [Terramyces sp. JEL0728]|nr:hypothetical protein HDV01_000637 [Terramyces sp. JEL0728]